MTQEPDLPAPATDGADPLDDTQPVEVPRFAPTPDPRPDTRWAWANSEPRTASVQAQAAGANPAWAAGPVSSSTNSMPASSFSAAWDATGVGTATSDWSAPTPQASSGQRRSGPGVGTVAAVALLAAVIGSSGTIIALGATGTFDAPAAAVPTQPTPAGPTTSGSGGVSGGVSADDSAAVIASSSKISPSVVKITTTDNPVTDPLSGTQTDGVGSGIIYDANGWILTNHHVVSGATTLKVETKDGKTYQGTVYGIDTLTDLAIVKVDATGMPAANLGSSDALKVGQLVVAVGSPLGTYSFSVTSGIVSAKGREYIARDGSTFSNLIQTDAAINAGNAGGPLADADGNVVGISTVIADNSEGIGFAIPIDIAKPIMAQAVKGQKLERPYIGIRYEMINPRVKADTGVTVDNGALVTNTGSGTGGSAIASNSPAAAAGLKDGDILTAINGIAIDQEHPLNLLLVQFAPQDTVTLTVLRAGQTLTVPLTLGVRPANLK
jgi:S1-C subfamily serine protease